MISADIMPSPENITFDPAQLNTNSNYNVSVLASNIAGSAVSYTRISECSSGVVAVVYRKVILSRGATCSNGQYQFTFLQAANYKSKT